MSKEEILEKNSNGNGWFEQEFEAISAAMTEYAHQAIEAAAEAANIRYTPCGDPMTCACQGTCDHLMAHIDKKSILKLKEKY